MLRTPSSASRLHAAPNAQYSHIKENAQDFDTSATRRHVGKQFLASAFFFFFFSRLAAPAAASLSPPSWNTPAAPPLNVSAGLSRVLQFS